MIRKILIPIIIVMLCVSIIPMNTIAQISYEERMKYCKENPEIKTGTTIDGQTMSMKWIPEDCMVGASLPNFETNTITGKTIDAAYFKKKMNVFVFWFDACPPCIAKIPALNELKDKYGDKKINFLAIGKDGVEDIESFIAEKPFNFDLVANGQDIKRKIFQSPWGYPLTIVTNRKGEIIYAKSGGKDNAEAIEETLQTIEPLIIKGLKLKRKLD